MVRKLLGTIVGAVFGGIGIVIVQALSHAVYPPPEGLDPQDLDAVRAHVSELPAGALLFVLGSYVLGSFVAGGVAGRISRSLLPSLLAGALLMVGGVVNVVVIPHPLWFTVASVLVYLPVAWLGGRSVGAGKTEA